MTATNLAKPLRHRHLTLEMELGAKTELTENKKKQERNLGCLGCSSPVSSLCATFAAKVTGSYDADMF